MPDFGPYLERERNRGRLIDATLELWATFGYRATTLDQIAVAADIAPAHFVDYFDDKDAVLMAVLDDAEQAVTAAFADVGSGSVPDQALLTAIVEDLTMITHGCGAVASERLAVIAKTVRARAAEGSSLDLTRADDDGGVT